MSSSGTSAKDVDKHESESIQVIMFNGHDEKWCKWLAKTCAFGALKGWWEAIDRPAVDPNDKKAVEEREKAIDKAHHYLLLACCDDAFTFVEGCTRNAKVAWNAHL